MRSASFSPIANASTHNDWSTIRQSRQKLSLPQGKLLRSEAAANFALELTRGPFAGTGKGQLHGGTAAAYIAPSEALAAARRPPRRGEAGAGCPRADQRGR